MKIIISQIRQPNPFFPNPERPYFLTRYDDTLSILKKKKASNPQ